MPQEDVLCIPRALFDEIGAFQGIQSDLARYIPRILERENTHDIPRSRAENDPSWKQIIPYVLFRKGDRFLYYVRGKGSGEKRLVAKGSIGIGGHINYGDQSLFRSGLESYQEALQREVREEVSIDGPFTAGVIALLNDDSTPVGQVHLGVIHLCELTDQEVTKREACITELRFLTLPELVERRSQLETWSQICLDLLAGAGGSGRGSFPA